MYLSHPNTSLLICVFNLMLTGKGDVMRAVVPEDKVSWNILHEWYDPTDFTDDAVADTDTDDV